MPFKLTELVIESVIRDGLKLIKDSINTDTDIIEDVFGEMLEPHLETYFGQKEINFIKDTILNDTIYVSQGYSLSDVKTPLISINLASNTESEQYAAFEDYLQEVDTPITPAEIVPAFNATSYNSTNGFIDLNAANPDLSAVRIKQIFVDGDGNKYPIVGGINDATGFKHIAVDRDQPITNLTGCIIQSSVESSRRVQRGVRDFEPITITIMSEQQLLTKYLYTIVKYIILSNKDKLIGRGLELSSYDGTDFMRSEHLPDNVFARFLTIKCGFIEHTWLAESRTIFGYADPAIKVRRDLYRREDEDELTVETILEDD